MAYGMLFAIISAVFWAFVNIIDKYAISKRVKSPIGYTAVVGLVNLVYAIIIASFISWTNISLNAIMFSIIAGFFFGLATFFYVLVLKSHDVSHVVGLIYTYPLIIALLSFLFMGEKLSLFGYVGVLLTISGASLVSIRLKKTHLTVNIWFIIGIILFTALDEFFIKLSTDNLNIWQGAVINNLSLGITLLCGLFHPSIRKNFFSELKNFAWEGLSAIFVLCGIFTLYFAMSQLQATIVSSIAAIQPLIVLLFERIINQFVGKITKDNLLLPKTGAIILIVVGVVLLYISV